MISPLILIVERHIADMNSHALFDAACAQFFIQSLETPDVLEPPHSLVVVEIRHRDELFERLPGDDEIPRVVARDRHLLIVLGVLIVDNNVLFLRFRLRDIGVKPRRNAIDELLHARARRRGDLKELQPFALRQFPQTRQMVCRGGQVDFVCDEDLRAPRDLFTVTR